MLDVKDIRQARKKLGLTQAKLANEAGVSQSVIAKIEAGRIDPGYSLVQKILATLERHRKKTSLKARDIMHKGIFALKPDATIAQAVRLMQKHGISQVLVQDTRMLGLVTESTILGHANALKKPVSGIMEAAPPMLPPDADISAVSALLQHYALILVIEAGKPLGVITKSDVLAAMV